MVHDGQSKPALGKVSAQLLLGACVLLVPPLLMVAGTMYVGSSPKDARVEAERTDKRAELATSFAVASATQHPVMSDPSSVAEGPAAPAAASTQKQISKDSTRYKGPITIGDGSQQSPTVEVENPQTATVADLSSEAEQLQAERSPARSATPHLPDAVAAVEEAQPASPGTNVSGSWVVQLSAQRTEEEARSAFRTAQAKYSGLAGYQVLIRKKDQGRRGVFYAAQVGPLPRDEANGLCNRIKNARGNCFIQTLPD